MLNVPLMLSVSGSWADDVPGASASASAKAAVHRKRFKRLIGLLLSFSLRQDAIMAAARRPSAGAMPPLTLTLSPEGREKGEGWPVGACFAVRTPPAAFIHRLKSTHVADDRLHDFLFPQTSIPDRWCGKPRAVTMAGDRRSPALWRQSPSGPRSPGTGRAAAKSGGNPPRSGP